MTKGVDRDFIHYGIRREDLRVIEAICNGNDIDYEWLQEEILAKYHNKHIEKVNLDDTEVEKIISSAISKVKL